MTLDSNGGAGGFAWAPTNFQYSTGSTPYLYTVFPSVSFGGGGTLLNWYGTHRIINLGGDKDMGDVYGLYIGDSICNRFGIFQDDIAPNSNQFIQCFQPALQKAGKYSLSEYLVPGRSASWDLSWKATFDNKERFQFVVLPLVNATTSSGSIYGQDLVIKGTGFSPNTSEIKVSVDGVNCNVFQSTLTSINCKLEAKVNQSAVI